MMCHAEKTDDFGYDLLSPALRPRIPIAAERLSLPMQTWKACVREVECRYVMYGVKGRGGLQRGCQLLAYGCGGGSGGKRVLSDGWWSGRPQKADRK